MRNICFFIDRQLITALFLQRASLALLSTLWILVRSVTGPTDPWESRMFLTAFHHMYSPTCDCPRNHVSPPTRPLRQGSKCEPDYVISNQMVGSFYFHTELIFSNSISLLKSCAHPVLVGTYIVSSRLGALQRIQSIRFCNTSLVSACRIMTKEQTNKMFVQC